MNTTRSFLILVNPTSGRGRALRKAEEIASRLRRQNLDVAVRTTSARGDARRMAHEAATSPGTEMTPGPPMPHETAMTPGPPMAHDTAKGHEAAQVADRRPFCIVACGGDGTVQEVAGALAAGREALGDQCPVLGLVPAGRCNDFARGVGVSGKTDDIAEILANGRAALIDLGRVNDRFFCTVATVGIDAEVTSYVHTMKMPLRGTPAYLYGALRVLSRYRPRRLKISGDFGIIDRPLFLASSANTSSYGGSIRIAPDAVPTDGQIDVCLIDAVRRLRALRLIASVLRGRHGQEPEVQFLRTRSLTIDADPPLDLWADGELVASTPARIEVVPQAIRVLVPAAGSVHEVI